MALYLETIKEDGSVVFKLLKPGQHSVDTDGGIQFRVVDSNTGTAESVNATRVGDNLVVNDADNSVYVELCGFYRDDDNKDKQDCELVGPDGATIAATAAPEVLMAANKPIQSDDNKAAAESDDTELSGMTILGGGLLVAGAAALLDGDSDAAAVAADPAMDGGIVGDGDSADNSTSDDDNAADGGDGDAAGGGGDAADGGGGAAGGGDAADGDGDAAGGGDAADGGGDAAGGGANDGGEGGDNGGLMVPASPSVIVENGDNNIDGDEMADGQVTIFGITDPAADVTVSWLGNKYSVGTDAAGNYTMDIPVGDLSPGDSQLSAVASNINGTSEPTLLDVTVADTGGAPAIPVIPDPTTISTEDVLGGDDAMVEVHDGTMTISTESGDQAAGSNAADAGTSETSVDCDANCPVSLTSILDNNSSVGMI